MKKEDRVAVLGPEGTFTDLAARKVFPDGDFHYLNTVDEVFSSVEEGLEFGVVAIENSLEGSVSTTMDCLIDYEVKIYKEIIMDINLCLLARPGAKIEDIECVISHPHALAQCRKFLHENLPGARLQRAESTAAAMNEVKDLEGGAAIGPKESAGIYKLEILAEGIEDAKSQTRFIVISKRNGKGGKTSIIFAVKDKPGTLYGVLKEFAQAEINLTKIESRPSKRKLGEYFFFMDFQGSEDDTKVRKVLDSIKEKTTFLKVLGSY